MNFLIHQVVSNGNRLPDGPHLKYCYIYEGEHCSCGGNYQGSDSGPDLDAFIAMTEAFRRVDEELILFATPEAARVRELMKEAVGRGDHETVRREGYYWSGRIALLILELADRVEAVG